ncbi:RcpC/CpaB family pilus assembly protein [Photobacterium japonica]|uniref:Flp pilus assembly protein CpaB n=1 Tax=Photobacterium japonica TaxID=2910235 RepID=UPI003D09AC81
MNSKIIFLIAFLAVVSGLYGLYDVFSQEPELREEPMEDLIADKPVRYLTLWRANQDVDKGIALNASDLTREQVPFDDALKLGVKDDVVLDFDPATLLNTAIKKGQWVYPEYQTQKNQPGYIDLLISDGMTLYPLQVTTKNLINDFIRPGDYIDLLAISSPDVNLSAQSEPLTQFQGVQAKVFLQHVKVMNIGEHHALSVNKGNDSFITAKSANESDGMTTVVIEVPPNQLARLSLAQRTLQLEIYRSHAHAQPLDANVHDVISNFTDVEELRGSNETSAAGGLF